MVEKNNFNYFGDPDNFHGFIFIPVEKEGKNVPPAIVVFKETRAYYYL